jgi:hypothetical protein
MIIYPILLYIFSKKYQWSDWKEKLTGKIRYKKTTLFKNNKLVMKEVTYKSVHSDFKLMDFLNKKDLCRVSYCLIKEGDEFEKSIGDLLDWFDETIYRFPTNFWNYRNT